MTQARSHTSFRRPLGAAPGVAMLALSIALGVSSLGSRAALAQDAIVPHPDQLQYPPLTYKAPSAADYRVKLANGMVAYMVPDRTLPLVTVTVMMRIGPDLDPAGKEGLAAMAMNLLTRSGTPTKTAKALEDRVASLGARLTSDVGGLGGGNPFAGGPVQVGPSESFASVNLLSKDVGEGIAILAECLRGPAWDPERIKLRKDQVMQSMKQRNDESANIEEREWGYLLRGDGHWTNRYPTAASIEAITASDLDAFLKRYAGPKNFLFAISGDFDRSAMTKKLDQALKKWPTPGERPGAPAAPTAAATGGWYMVDKDVNQGRVSIGLTAIDRYDPDYQAARIMNDILGGGGFSSRLVNRIRSDEGLAYSVNSRFEGGVYYNDPWRMVFQSKVRSVAYATQIAMTEVNRMRDSLVTENEITISKNKFIESLPAQFETATAIAVALANEELTGRYQKDPKYFAEVRDRIRAVTREDVQRVAKRLIDPSKFTVLMVGNAKDMMLGDPKHDASITAMAQGEPKHLPLRDPMTMKPMPNP